MFFYKILCSLTHFKFLSAFIYIFLLFYGFNLYSNISNENITTQIKSEKVKPLASKIHSIKFAGKTFFSKKLFKINNNPSTHSMLNQYLNNFTPLILDKSERDRLLNTKDENIVFAIPLGENKFMELELTKENVITSDFKAGALSGNGTVNYSNYTPGLYYRGIIKGDNQSFASLSIFNDFVMMLASNKNGNWNLSSIKSQNSLYSDYYVFYNDIDVISNKVFTCGVSDENPIFDKRNFGFNNGNFYLTNPPQLVRKYFECDFKMYQDFGSNITNVNNYVTAFFNSCIAMYAQDSINTSISQIFVWTTLDPYASLTNNTSILKLLGGRLQNAFNGDLAHWISTRTDISGGVAWLGVLCEPFNASDSSGRYAVSIIDNQHLPWPQYSWVVNVIVHEMGHNLGSNHTFWCGWPGGPIDTCYQVEGGCYSGPLRPRIGTVMSYCHLNSSINLALGFGQLPGDTIRAHVRRAPCLLIGITPINSEIPTNFYLEQNYPNPFNPTTQIKFSLPQNTFISVKIFNVTGELVAILVDNEFRNAGYYEVSFGGTNFASGIYFYTIEAGNFKDSKKMVLIK